MTTVHLQSVTDVSLVGRHNKTAEHFEINQMLQPYQTLLSTQVIIIEVLSKKNVIENLKSM